MQRKDILILGSFLPDNASVINDYFLSFQKYSRHRFFYMTRLEEWDVGFDFNRFDALLLFWSCAWFALDLPTQLLESMAGARGAKILMLQDEYRRVRFTNLLMHRLGINVMLTNAAPQDHQLFYPPLLVPSLRHVSTVLTGYVPEYLEKLSAPPWKERRIDVGYRSRMLPYWLGDLGQEKRWIAEQFTRICRQEGFSQDISVREKDRLYGQTWLDFLCSCKFVLGTESGASLIDFDGEIERSCEQYLAANPGASYEACKKALFERLDWRNTLRTISPRTFEAAACGNVMVMHEGEYAGILRPDVHYISIRKDYSNLTEVVARMRDERFCQGLRENSYRDLIASGRFRYETFIEDVDKVLDRVEKDAARGHKRCSRTSFYLSGYLKHGQTVIPLGDRCLFPPSWGRCFRLFWLGQELLKQPALLVCLLLLSWVVLHGLVRKVRKRIRRRHGRGLACPSPATNLLHATTPSQPGTPPAQAAVEQSPPPERRLLFGLLHNCYHGLMTLAVFRKMQMGTKVYGEQLRFIPDCSASGRLVIFRPEPEHGGSVQSAAEQERMGRFKKVLLTKQHRNYRFDYSRFSGTLPLKWLGWFSVSYFPPSAPTIYLSCQFSRMFARFPWCARLVFRVFKQHRKEGS